MTQRHWSSGLVVAVAALAALSVLCSGHPMPGYGGGFVPLRPHFYDHSCPQMNAIIGAIVAKEHARDPRMAASLLRMHFHDCFVQGCDASVLLDADGSGRFTTEKRSIPNRDSLRGYEVIDEIKAALEHACPHTVSCADIIAVVARDSTVLVRTIYSETVESLITRSGRHCRVVDEHVSTDRRTRVGGAAGEEGLTDGEHERVQQPDPSAQRQPTHHHEQVPQPGPGHRRPRRALRRAHHR
jgi:hypothetical protein